MQTQELSFYMANKSINTDYPVAILIDGGFFLKRYRRLIDKNASPKKVADHLFTLSLAHLDDGNTNGHLYRILYYDCNPLSLKIHNPINKKLIDFGKSDIANWRFEFFEELKKKRKVALRLGHLKTSKQWLIYPRIVKELIAGNKKIDELSHEDVFLDMGQKGIDIKIGVDITSIALKGTVRKIVLISGDSDFVPAAKLARREGVDFILDPMRNNIDPSLFEHIDGLRTTVDLLKGNKKGIFKGKDSK